MNLKKGQNSSFVVTTEVLPIGGPAESAKEQQKKLPKPCPKLTLLKQRFGRGVFVKLENISFQTFLSFFFGVHLQDKLASHARS